MKSGHLKKAAAIALAAWIIATPIASTFVYAQDHEAENEAQQTAYAEDNTIPSAENVQNTTQKAGKVVYSNGFDTAVTPTGGSAKYWIDGKAPKDFLYCWIPSAEVPSKENFSLKLDDQNKVSGSYSIYCKSTAPQGTQQRLKLSCRLPEEIDYTQQYILRAKVKSKDAGRSFDWGGAALRVDVAGTSRVSPRVMGTSDWKTIELELNDLVELANGQTSGSVEVGIIYEHFVGEVWFDDIELVSATYTIQLDKENMQLELGQTGQLNVSGAPEGELVQWSSSDPEIASVDENGCVKALKGGVAVITASTDAQHTASCMVVVSDPEAEKYFQQIRERWAERCTGNQYWNEGNPAEDYQSIVNQYNQQAREAQEQLVMDSDAVLFRDLNLTGENIPQSGQPADSAQYVTAVSRMENMARAWAAQGSEYYHSPQLAQKIVYALQWFHTHAYNEQLDKQQLFGNWKHWWVEIPQKLASTSILMYDQLSPELLQKQAAALEHFNEDPAYVYGTSEKPGRMEVRGADLAGTSLVSVLRGAMANDQNAVINGVKYFSRVAGIVGEGEGIYADGSLIARGNLAYTGVEGPALLNGVEKLIYLTDDTAWQIASAQVEAVYGWIWNGVRPLYADGAVFDMVSGRKVASPANSDYKTGRDLLAAVTMMLPYAGAEMQKELSGFVKAQLQYGIDCMGEQEYCSTLDPAAVMAMKMIADDPAVKPYENTGYAHVFGVMDKAVAHNSLFSFGVSYASSRTGRLDFGDGQNKNSWHQGDGATYIYNGDPLQYSDNYWNTVDPQRLAGITTDHSTWPLKEGAQYNGNANYNGGSVVGPYATIAMNFRNHPNAENPSLTARKTWFVMDDEIVALGAGVTNIDPDRVTETIVENKKISGDNLLLVDGKEMAPNLGDAVNVKNASWAWLDGNGDADAMGYYFPEGEDIDILREQRTGSWSDVNGTVAEEEEVVRNYLSLAIPHGENVNNKLDSWKREYYDYVLLPGMSRQQVEQYAQNPDIEVLCNSTFVQAVRDNKANVTGYVFWGDAEVPVRVGDVEAVKGAVTVVKDSGNHTMTIGVADPLQNNSSLTFRIYGKNLALLESDPNISAEIDKYGAVLTVNTENAKGATFTAVFACEELSAEELEELNDIRENYSNAQTGNNMPDKSSKEYRSVMEKYSEEARDALEHLNRDAQKGENLFDDIDVQLDWVNKGTQNTDGSAALTSTTLRIKNMALAYTSEGCTEYYHDPQLKDDILFCLEYVFDCFPNIQNYHDKTYANWWDWAIGMPKNLTAVGNLIYDELSEDMRRELHDYILILVPDVDKFWSRSSSGRADQATATAANAAEMAMLTALNGLLNNDTTSLYKASDSLAASLRYVTKGEGFYPDGSYKQHGNFAYTGSYGVEMLRGVAQILSITDNTTWECTTADTDIVYEWILNSYRPLYADGALFDMVQGRSVSRHDRSDMTSGRYTMDAILTLAANAPEQYREQILSFAKTQTLLGVEHDAETYFGKLRFSSLIMALSLLEDDTIPLDTAVYSKIYGYMDKASVHGEGYALGISMFSSRNGATECLNGENLHGWYFSDGALALYNGDRNQYSTNYWATVDPLRLAGITTNHVTTPLKNGVIQTNNRDWVGGSTIDKNNYASIGQDFKSNYSDLQAKKSWFVFDDQIVALGAGISTSQGDFTETIVENRRVDNNNRLLVDGIEIVPENGKEEVQAQWAWLSSNKDGSAIGYYFPQKTQLDVKRETRTGKWSDINSSNYPGKPDVNSPENTVSNDFISIAVEHDAKPGDENYSYVLLPGKTQQQMQAYAAENSIRILSNTNQLQAAADVKTGVYGANFWKEGSVELDNGKVIAAQQPASVTMAEENGVMTIGISDPTQKNASTTIRIEGDNLKAGSCDEAVSVQEDETGVTFVVDTKGAYGQTFRVQLYDLAEMAQTALQQAEDFLHGTLTIESREQAEQLLEQLRALEDAYLTEEQTAQRDQLLQRMQELLDDISQVSAIVEQLKQVDRVTEQNADDVKHMLEEYEKLDDAQKSLLTDADKQLAAGVKKMLEEYLRPKPTATPVPTAKPEPTATPVPTAQPDPTAAPVPTATPAPQGDAIPQTGDRFRTVSVLAVLVACTAAGICLVRKKDENL